MCVFGMYINVVLAVVNLIPIPPLDGGRVLVACLPRKISDVVDRIEPFGLIIVILLMVSGALGPVMERPIELFARRLPLRCGARVIGRTSCQDGCEAESASRASGAAAGDGGSRRRRAGARRDAVRGRGG